MDSEITKMLVDLSIFEDWLIERFDITDNGGPNEYMKLRPKVRELIDEIEWIFDK